MQGGGESMQTRECAHANTLRIVHNEHLDQIRRVCVCDTSEEMPA